MLLLHFGIVCLHGMVGLTIRTASDGLNLSLDHKIQLFSVGCICLFLCKKMCMKTLQGKFFVCTILEKIININFLEMLNPQGLSKRFLPVYITLGHESPTLYQSHFA